MWNKLNYFWQAIVAILGIFTIVLLLASGISYLEHNGISTRINDVADYELIDVPEGIKFPIEVEAMIEYHGDYIKSSSCYVEFCDVKETRKEMKREMKAKWKEMKQACN